MPRIRPLSQREDLTVVRAQADQRAAPTFGLPDTERHVPVLAPLRALVAAILQRAVDDLELGVSPRARAIAWFRETGAADQPGSFEWCCGVLDIDPGALRDECAGSSLLAQPH